jgi:hypothetical protein
MLKRVAGTSVRKADLLTMVERVGIEKVRKDTVYTPEAHAA